MIVTAALYARVSTPNQEEEDTIDSQVAAIEQYIQDRGYELPSEFYFLDKAVSGARLDRPALDRLRHLASDGAFAIRSSLVSPKRPNASLAFSKSCSDHSG